jgi:hypothetical protein
MLGQKLAYEALVHYVIFLEDEFLAIQTFCELVARIIKLLDSGGVRIELPEEYKDPNFSKLFENVNAKPFSMKEQTSNCCF